MTWNRELFLCALTALSVLQSRVAIADSGRCFDLSSPTIENILNPSKVQRLLIQEKNPSPEAHLAAETLSAQAKERGIEVVFSARAWNSAGASEQDQAARVCKENSAQLVASVQFLTGTEAARVEFRDPSGQSVGSSLGWLTDGGKCTKALFAPEESAASSSAGDTWYGWQLLIADASAVALAYSRLGSSKDVRGVAVLTYAVVPALIHGANGQPRRLGLSLLLRVVVPLSLGLTVAALSIACWEGKSDQETCNDGATAMLVSAGLAALVDDLFLAWKPALVVTQAIEQRPSSPAQGLSLSVGLLPYRQGAGLGMAGRF